MTERSVHEAAVAAMAEAQHACYPCCDHDDYDDGYADAPPCVLDAKAALAALVASAEVREADVPCLLHPGQEKCGGATRGANVRLHPACFLAALAGTDQPTEKGTS